MVTFYPSGIKRFGVRAALGVALAAAVLPVSIARAGTSNPTVTVTTANQAGLYKVYGGQAGLFGGTESRGAVFGDFNGDGYDDVAIARYGIGASPATGSVHFVWGGPDLDAKRLDLFNTPSGDGSHSIVVGGNTTDGFGWSIAAGDFNGDGYDDVALGAPLYTSTPGTNIGMVHVFYGNADLQSAGTQVINLGSPGQFGSTRIQGRSLNHQLGYALAFADINADGFDDLIMGAPGANSNRGQVYVVYGGKDKPGNPEGLGSSINLWSGSEGDHGETIIRGGNATGAQFGYSLASGDINGDGYPDLVVGSPAIANALLFGRVFTIYGQSGRLGTALGAGSEYTLSLVSLGSLGETVISISALSVGDEFGASVACGDVNADGYDDIVIGAPKVAVGDLLPVLNVGQTHIIYGTPDKPGLTALLGSVLDIATNLSIVSRLNGPFVNAESGRAVACGDVNGDGYADVLVGNPLFARDGLRGGAFVLSGNTIPRNVPISLGSLPSTPSLVGFEAVGPNFDDRLGASVAAGGDMQRSGRAGFVVMGPNADNPFSTPGNRLGIGAIFLNSHADAQISVKRRIRAGQTPRMPFGGRLAPEVRAFAAFDGGNAVSDLTFTRFPDSSGISNLRGNPDDVLDVMWRAQSTRVGAAEMQVAFKYLESEMPNNGVGQNRNQVRVWSAPNIAGPWTMVENTPPTAADAARNQIAAGLANPGANTFFALVLDDTPPAVDSITRLSPTDESTNSDPVIFRVEFTEAVLNLVADNFSLNTTGGQATASILGVTPAGSGLFDVEVKTVPGAEGWVRLDLDTNLPQILDALGNELGVAFTSGQRFWVDRLAPQVTGIVRTGGAPPASGAETVSFTVALSEPVTGLSPANFSLSATGDQVGASINSVTAVGPGQNYLVEVATQPGTGEIGLNLNLGLSGVVDAVGNVLQSAFASTQTFLIDRKAPGILSVTRAGGADELTNAGQVQFAVSFDEPVLGVAPGLFNVVATGSQSGALISNVTGSGATWTVTVDAVEDGEGEIGLELNLPNLGLVTDLLGNVLDPIIGLVESYLVDRVRPEALLIVRSTGAPELTTDAVVGFDVVFSEDIVGLNPADLVLATTGDQADPLTGAQIVSVTGAGANWTVEVATGVGTGSLRLDIDAGLSAIEDLAGNFLNANLTGSELYLVNRTTSELVVDTTTDIVDGVVATVAALLLGRGPDNAISLPEAIAAANNTPGDKIIRFDASLANQTIELSANDIILTADNITIDATGLNITLTSPGASLDYGILVESANNRVLGLSIVGFNEFAIGLEGATARGNIVQGCHIGTNASGDAGLGNELAGLWIVNGASDNLIGGSLPGQGNVIAGNGSNNPGDSGIVVSGTGTANNRILGNIIGLGLGGQPTGGLGNLGDGIVVRGGATGTVIGGAGEGEGNIINGNAGAGIVISDGGVANTTVFGNRIGTDGAGTREPDPALGVLGNGTAGVSITSAATDSTIGGTAPGQGNVIWNNKGVGVFVDGTGTDRHEIRGNSITNNVGAAIETSAGGNTDLAPPVIDNLVGTPNAITISGTAAPGVVIAFYVDDGDQGELFLAGSGVVSDAVTGAFSKTINLAGQLGRNVLATATDILRNTSRLGLPKQINLAPVITLNGPASVTVECGVTSTQIGATAQDDIDGDLTGAIVATGDTVDLAVPGVYVTTYNVSDLAGLPAIGVSQTVNVVDTLAPVIALNGAANITLQCNVDTYLEAGATVTDGCAGDISAALQIGGGAVDTTAPGTYIVTYAAQDIFGNVATTVTRTVEVVDSLLPVITLNGSDSVTLFCGESFLDPGATVADLCSGVLAPVVTGVVDTDTAGVYPIAYNATDAAGNAATAVVRTVTVLDNTPPTITLNGAALIDLNCGDPFVDPGATATDDCAGDLSAGIVVTGAVDPDVEGVYTLRYNVSDPSGNAAAEVTRTVSVGVCGVPIPFADAALEAALRAELIALGATPGPVLTDIDLANPAFTSFSANGLGITDLSGLEFAVNLEFLSLRNNGITDLTPLAGLINLRQLLLHGNLIDDITPLAGLVNLEELYLHFNDVEVLAPLAGMPALKRFEAQSNQIEDLTPLTLLTNLETLRLANNAIVDVAPLEGLLNLKIVDLSLNPIEDITPLVDNTGLGSGSNVNLTGAPLSQTSLCDGVGALAARGVVVNATGVCNTPPVITLIGPATINVSCGQTLSVPGATATDAEDDDIELTAAIVVGGDTVDTGTPGVYVITYDVTDSGGLAAAQVQRTIVVADSQPPTLALIGANPATVQCGATFVDPGATANDVCEGNLDAAILTGGTVNTAVPGVYTLTYDVSDGAGNAAAQATRTVNVVDTTAPAITLTGPAFLNVQCGSPYTDAGATAADACSGDLTAQITATGTVNTGAPGAYTIRFNVSDAAGNAAAEVTRTVTVVDSQAPVITLIGAAVQSIACGAAFNDPGATATDTCAGNLTGQIVATGTVNTAVPGTYQRRYNVSDPSGRAATEVVRTVTVVDNVAPVITLNGAAGLSVACGSPFNDPGATATDACAGDLTAQIVATGTVNTAVPGTYQRRYNVSDPSGRAATEVVRTVTVADNVAPTLTLSGATLLTLSCGAPFVEPGFTATDTCAGNLTGLVEVSGFVDPDTPGDYTVFYRVADASGNSTERTRTVRVIPDNDPVITLTGTETVSVACGGSFVEPGVTAADACGNTLPVLSDAATAVNRSRSGAYTVTYTATDGAGNTATARRFVVVNCGQPPCDQETVGRVRFCVATVRPNDIDLDGDGLSANLEACLCTSDESIDSDGDGIADNFEVAHPDALDPTDPTDALCDPDSDSLSNLEEFFKESDPTDPNSPNALFWVAPPAVCGTASTSGAGTMASPWRSIAHAISQVQARGLGGTPVRINLLPGDYCEAVTLLPNMVLARGVPSDPCDPAGADPCAADLDSVACQARIFGGVTGANGSEVVDLVFGPDPTLTPRIGQDSFLLVVNNAEMRVNGCRFSGNQRNGTRADRVHGMRTLGASGDTIVEFSAFTNLYIGIVVAGDIPAIRRNLFQDLDRHAVLILARTATGPERSIGAIEDPSRGFNTFVFDRIGDSVVVNLRGATVRMENNDWNTNSPSTVAGIVSGPATFEPFVVAGNAVFAGSLFCTVWAADNQQRITNATVRLDVSNFLPVSQNVNAVYGFPAVVEGVYDVVVRAAGFEPTQQRVTVLPGQFVSVTVALPREIAGEGEGEGEGEGAEEGEGEGEDPPPPPPGGCCQGPNKDIGIPLGDGLVGAITLGVFLSTGIMMRRRTAVAVLRT